MSLALASKSPARSGLSATRTAFPARVRPAFSKSRIFWTASWASARESCGEASEGEVGEEIVAVDGGVEGVGGGPEEGGPGEGRGEEVLPGGPGEEALGVVGGVAEEEDVAGSGSGPVVVGEGEEVADGVGGGFSEAEVVVDLLEGDGHGGEALGLSVEDEGLGGGEKGLGGDEDPVGLVGGVAQRGGLDGADLGAEEGGGGDGEVVVVGLGGEAREPVPRERPSQRGRRPERSRRTEPGGEARGLDDAVGEGLPSRTPASAARAWG